MHKIFIAQNLKAVLQYGTEKAKVCKYVQKMQREKLHWFFLMQFDGKLRNLHLDNMFSWLSTYVLPRIFRILKFWKCKKK